MEMRKSDPIDGQNVPDRVFLRQCECCNPLVLNHSLRRTGRKGWRLRNRVALTVLVSLKTITRAKTESEGEGESSE